MKWLRLLAAVLFVSHPGLAAPANGNGNGPASAVGVAPAGNAAPPVVREQTPVSGIERQRASIRRQLGVDPAAASDTFFTVPWPAPPRPAVLPGNAAVAKLPSPACDPLPEEQLASLTESAAKKEGLRLDLVRALIQQESGGRPCAVSAKGAEGLMQLMPSVQQTFQVSDAFDPAQNLAGGAKLLKQLLTRYNGDLSLTLAAYNAGAARVDQDKKVPDIPETRDYVASILKRLDQ